jgi:hypothetical protein
MSSPQPLDNPGSDFTKTLRAAADRYYGFFRQGHSTFEIANLCRVNESVVYNALAWRQERERQIAAARAFEAREAGKEVETK